jgi:Ca2+-binding RTX toxin-like protein
VFAPGAFASTMTENGGVATWTAATGINNNTTFTDTANSITIDTSDDPVTYDNTGANNNVTTDCIDDDGTAADGSASQVTCSTPPVTTVVANSEDIGDNEDASSLQFHAITINGGDGNDELEGGAKDDTLNGEAGDDEIQGLGGSDTINGGDGNDDMSGSHFCCGPIADGNDTITGGNGNDDGQGGPGNDSIDLGAGNDDADGGPGNDTINLGDGNDSADGGPGDDVMNGGAGDDELEGDCGGLNNCGAGSDGADTLSGGAGSDYLEGDGGVDTANGDAGDDYIREFVDNAADTDNGGDGNDTLEYDPNAGPNDTINVTQDGQANDGQSPGDGSGATPDNANNFGGDIEQFNVDSNNTPVHALLGSINNQINTGGGPDTVDAGPGVDTVNTGDGPDTVNAVDGFPDTVNCGPGDDTANVDQFDTVFNCETVNRTNVTSAFNVPEDAPPSVSWVGPAAGKTLPTSTATTLQVNATDDHGISKVEFYVGNRLVCTATTAPYTCSYRPLGSDLGRDTLVAIAYDTAGQTATSLNSVIVPRFAPKSITATTKPRKATTFPATFKTRGRVVLPAGVTAAQGCTGGHVSIQFRAGKKTISSRRVATSKSCTYSSSVKFRIPSRLHPRSLTVLVRFLGSTVLGPRSHKRYTVKVTV